jgi:hypothetical protein
MQIMQRCILLLINLLLIISNGNVIAGVILSSSSRVTTTKPWCTNQNKPNTGQVIDVINQPKNLPSQDSNLQHQESCVLISSFLL